MEPEEEVTGSPTDDPHQEPDDEQEAPAKPGSRILGFFRFVLRFLTIVLVGLISAVTAMRLAIHGREVQIPKLIGMSPQQAAQAAVADGLIVSVEHRFYSPDVPQGLIMSQMPPPGTKVRRGWQIRVAQSLGPQTVTIPSLLGQSMRAAEINLGRRGLELGLVASMPLPGALPGQIAAQSPPASAVGVQDPKISVLIGQAADPPSYLMPNFVGDQVDDAVKKVQLSGFTVGRINRAAPSPTPPPSPSPIPQSGTTVTNGSGSAAPPEATPSPAENASTGRIVRQYPVAGQKIFPGTIIQFDVD